MQIWVDADACPRAVKDILFRAADRTSTRVTLVANQPLSVPPSPYISCRQVAGGFDVADQYIIDSLAAQDLIITADIPLAAEAIDAGAYVLTPRGETLSEANIGARLNMRDFLDQMRGSGESIPGPPAYSQADKQAFANSLDRLLTRIKASGLSNGQ